MQHCTFIPFAHKYFIRQVFFLFMLYQNALSINSEPQNFKEDNQTLENNYPNYFDSTRLCNGDTCKELYEKIGYPYKEIKDTIDAIMTTPISSSIGPASIQPSMGRTFPGLEVKCKESYHRRFFLKEKDIDGQLQYIINVEGFYQPTDITTCYNKTLSCVQQYITPENYGYQCTQIYTDISLYTFPVNQSITENSRILSVFRIPDGCICKEARKRDAD